MPEDEKFCVIYFPDLTEEAFQRTKQEIKPWLESRNYEAFITTKHFHFMSKKDILEIIRHLIIMMEKSS